MNNRFVLNIYDLSIGKSAIDNAGKIYQYEFNGIYRLLKDRYEDVKIGDYIHESQVIQGLNETDVIIVNSKGDLLYTNM